MLDEKELEHRRIARKMDSLDKWSARVAFGFIVFWILYGITWGITVANFF